MTLRISAKSSEQKPWYNLNIKIFTPSKRRGLEHSSAFLMSPKKGEPKGKGHNKGVDMHFYCHFAIL